MKSPLLTLLTAVTLGIALACGSASEQMERSYTGRLESLDAAAAANPSRAPAILSTKASFAQRYAALPADPAAREAALGKLNQDMAAAISAEEAAATAVTQAAAAADAAAGATIRTSLNGNWSGGGMVLNIDPGGSVHYERSGSVNKTIDASIQNVTGTGFDVGVFGLNTHFVLTTPPHDAGGVWKMTVDGVELTRS